MLGYSYEELIGLPGRTSRTRTICTRAKINSSDCWRVCGSVCHRQPVHSQDGSEAFINISVGCVRKPDGTVDYALALLDDITARRRAEEGLRLDEARLEALVRLNDMAEAPIDEITAFCLDTAIALTKSKRDTSLL